MKTIRLALAALVAVFLTAVPLFAQTQLTTTTLTAAVADQNTTSVSVLAATGISAPGTGSTLTYLFVDTELMQVRTVNGTAIGVLRGAGGTTASAHAVNALVYVGPPANFTSVDFVGACTASNFPNLPLINTRNGNVWNCATSVAGAGLWQGYSTQRSQELAPRTAVAGSSLATSSYTILPTDYIVVLSSSGTAAGGTAVAVKSFTLPSHLGLAGKQLIIKDESGGIGATTKIVLVGTIDGTNSAVANVVELKTPWGAVTLEAGSGGWFTVSCHGGNGSTTCR